MADNGKVIKKELYEVLACPVCRGRLSYTEDMNGLYCPSCRQVYPIREGIPLLMPP